MGRKIPGRKHHGVKDPEKQRAERFKLIKHKVNAPPVDPDDQQVPKSLQRLSQLRDKARLPNRKKVAKKPTRPREFEQLPGESDGHFIHRVSRICEVVKKEAAFAEKYGVDVNRNSAGEVESVTKRPKDPLEIMVKELRKEKRESKKQKRKKKKGGDDEDPKPRLSKSQKRSHKLAEKKRVKLLGSQVQDFDRYKDEVQFGETAHAPPTLTVPKRAEKHAGGFRPGSKDLLLKSMLQPVKKVIDRSGKRRDLPSAVRRQLDKQQEEVIQAYKKLKADKLTSK